MMDGKNLRWLACIIGGLTVVFFGVFFIGVGMPDKINDAKGQLHSMMILMGFAFLGYLFAWFREKEGGYVLIFSGIIMGLTMFYRGGQNDITMALVYSVPFIVSGLLFILGSMRSHPT